MKKNLVKVLSKKGLIVTQTEYNKYDHPSDKYYYYVFYSNIPDNEGNYIVFTNPINFGDTRLIFKSKNKEEAIQNAENINKSLRLMAGYYDDNIVYKDKCFPSTLIK